jgi:hypothetical protein
MNSPYLDPLVAIAELHAEAPFDHQEHSVFVLVMMKDVLALELLDLPIFTCCPLSSAPI